VTRNDVLKSLRYTLSYNDSKMVEIFKLGNLEISKEEVIKLLKKEDEKDFLECDNDQLEAFLNGLIVEKRGPSPKAPEKVSLDNNEIFKKVKIAFKMTSDDIHRAFEKGGIRVSNSELSAILRKSDHRNYRKCGDRYLRNLLKGLALLNKGK